MNQKADFQIICSKCGCLAIRIEDPVSASREATVYCGDCGASRGTVGALRDLAVRPIGFASSATKSFDRTVDDPNSSPDISKQYEELQRLRRKVKMAESHAGKANRLMGTVDASARNATLTR
jgi:hypothetical protein